MSRKNNLTNNLARVGALAGLVGANDAWRNEAMCKEADPRLFDPPNQGFNIKKDGKYDYPQHVLEAVRVCAQCPVSGMQGPCYRLAETLGMHGVWGGVFRRPPTSHQQRHGYKTTLNIVVSPVTGVVTSVSKTKNPLIAEIYEAGA